MSLWKATITTEYGEIFNPILNVFGFYTTIPVIDEGNQLMDAVQAQLLPLVNGVQCETAYIKQLEVEELNGSAYGVRVYPSSTYVGARSGVQAAPFVAWSFKIVKAVLGKRSGGKRFGPISQNDVVDRTPEVGVRDALNSLATQLAAPLTIGLVETWFPVILERPASLGGVWGQHAVGGAYFEAYSTQNTRKK